MKRYQRRRIERLRRVVNVVGLSFAAGALAASTLTWRLEVQLKPDTTYARNQTGPLNQTTAIGREPAQDQTEPRAGERPAGPSLPSPVATTGVISHSAAVEMLRERDLEVPVDDVDEDDLLDTFFDSRNGRAHEAMDIMAPRHTAVRAVEDGTIVKLFNSHGGGGITIYQFDPTATFCYYYAHLDRYAPGLREGQIVERGQTIGYVGSTGNASPDAPHLHFAIFRLTPERKWWKGEPINPYSVFK